MKNQPKISNITSTSVDRLESEYTDIRQWLIDEVNFIQSSDFLRLDSLRKNFEEKFGILKDETAREAFSTIDRVIVTNLGYGHLFSKKIISWEILPAGEGINKEEEKNNDTREIEKGEDFFPRKQWTLAIARQVDEKAIIHNKSLNRKDKSERYWIAEFPSFGVAMFVANKNGKATYFTPSKNWQKFSKQSKLKELRKHNQVEYLPISSNIKNEQDWKEAIEEKILLVQKSLEIKNIGTDRKEKSVTLKSVEIVNNFPIDDFFAEDIKPLLDVIKDAYELSNNNLISEIKSPQNTEKKNVTFNNISYSIKLKNIYRQIGTQIQKEVPKSIDGKDQRAFLGRNYTIYRDKKFSHQESVEKIKKEDFPVCDFFEEDVRNILSSIEIALLKNRDKENLLIEYKDQTFQTKISILYRKIGSELQDKYPELMQTDTTVGINYIKYRKENFTHSESIKKLKESSLEKQENKPIDIAQFFQENIEDLLFAIKTAYGKKTIEEISRNLSEENRNIEYLNTGYDKKLSNIQQRVGRFIQNKTGITTPEKTLGRNYLIYRDQKMRPTDALKKIDTEFGEPKQSEKFPTQIFFSKNINELLLNIKTTLKVENLSDISEKIIREYHTFLLDNKNFHRNLRSIYYFVGKEIFNHHLFHKKLDYSAIGKHYLIYRDEGFNHEESIKKLQKL